MGWIGFPATVDEISARLVAAGVIAIASAAVLLDQPWLLVPLTYGFWARVLTGPRLSPLGRLVTRVIRPRLQIAARPVLGPPKRFAQGVGAAFTTTASILALTGSWGAAQVVLVMLIGAALLESALGVCLGCKVYGVCVLPLRHPAAQPATQA